MSDHDVRLAPVLLPVQTMYEPSETSDAPPAVTVETRTAMAQSADVAYMVLEC